MTALIFFISLFFRQPQTLQPSCDCQYKIYYFDLSQAFDAPCHLPDTISWTDAGIKNTLIITDCMGTATYTSLDLPKNQVIYSSAYKKAEILSVDTSYLYDENTSTETMRVETYYKPERTSVKQE